MIKKMKNIFNSVATNIGNVFDSGFDIFDDTLEKFTGFRLFDRKLNFDDANKLTRELINANIPASDNRYASRIVVLNNAILTISEILNEIYKKFGSDKEIADSKLDQKLRDINLSNLEIARRITDKSFYVGIIGEFSCGKSTFINALLEQRFLIEDVLAGTTCSKTVIRYAPKENIIVIFSNGSKQQMRKEDDGDLLDDTQKREFLREMTATESRAKDIMEVIWESPIEVLSNGLCIVDTPGIGTDNERHSKVAKDAARECDALLVLTNLEKPLSKELTETVKDIAGDRADKCVFIGTRKDQFPSKELSRMQRFFNNRLSKLYGHSCQFEFVSAYKALQDLEEGHQDGAGLTEFRGFRAKIRQLLESNRQVVQSIKAGELIADLNKDVTESFNAKKQDFDKKITEYQHMVIKSNSKKWQIWDKEMLQDFRVMAQDVKIKAMDEAVALVNRIREDIKDEIEDCSDETELKDYLKEGATKTINSYSSKIRNFPVRQLQNPLIKVANKVQKNHAKKFKKEYDKIKSIFGVGASLSLKEAKQNVILGNSVADMDELDKLSDDMDSEGFMKIGGGMAAGMVVALAIPGIGWLLGGLAALLGGLFGWFSFTSLEDRKEEACEKVDEAMDSFEEDLQDNINKNYNMLEKDIKSKLSEYGKLQKQKYLHEIDLYNKALDIKTNHLEETKVFLDGKIDILQRVKGKIDSVLSKEVLIFDTQNLQD